MTTSRAGRMEAFVHELQDDICSTLEDEGTARFREDEWEREEGGGGRSRVLEGGDLFEKAGVNVSAVHGPLPERMAAALDVDPAPFFATGLSVVVHPRNPHVPTAHANFRYFALGEDRARPADEWYGGGADLTPYYPRLSDVKHFHRVWKDVCDRHAEVAGYADFKRECDEYFYLDHREEARGVGGSEHARAESLVRAVGVRGGFVGDERLTRDCAHRGRDALAADDTLRLVFEAVDHVVPHHRRVHAPTAWRVLLNPTPELGPTPA